MQFHRDIESRSYTTGYENWSYSDLKFWNGFTNELSRAEYTPPSKHVCAWFLE